MLRAVGVDNGGTWIRMRGVDVQGRVVWSLQKYSPTVNKLPAFLRNISNAFMESFPHLAVGSRGVWKQAKRQSHQARAEEPREKYRRDVRRGSGMAGGI